MLEFNDPYPDVRNILVKLGVPAGAGIGAGKDVVASGHATESLPQIVLDVQGDDIHAIGVMGLVYGYSAMTSKRSA